jgi:hypothetical protein
MTQPSFDLPLFGCHYSKLMFWIVSVCDGQACSFNPVCIAALWRFADARRKRNRIFCDGRRAAGRGNRADRLQSVVSCQ